MLKESMLYLARQESIRTFVIANPATRRVARRFVAGEELSEALEVARTMNRGHISVSLDHLGENVTSANEARQTADEYVRTLDQIQATGVEANISVKLTALGLDLGDDLCRANLTRVLQRAQEYGSFVRVDMEGSDYTQRTLDLVIDLHQHFENVGTVIQSCMYSSPDDVALLIERGVRVRLVKGAYLEPPTIAFPHKVDVDAQYVLLMRALLERGVYPAIATHDEHIIREAIRIAQTQGIARARFEFQMLYGIRRDLQTKLADAGYNVRVYVPYGTQWYPYLTRRMAERPANLMFVVGNTFRG